MRGDTKSRFEAYTEAVLRGGWLMRSEVRERENLDAVEGLDVPLQPVNMVPAGMVAQPAMPADGPRDAGSPGDNLQEGRGAVLELQARRRVQNRETRAIERGWAARESLAQFAQAVTDFYAAHVPFVEEALAVPRAVSESYCVAQCDRISAAVITNKVPELLATWKANAEALEFSPLPSEPVKEKTP
jgi:hypothetical protein